jgi:ABC-type uncharacterized transport system substrate-binding protein
VRSSRAGKSLGAVPVSLPVRNAADIEAAINAFARESNGGLVLPTDVTTIVHRELIIELAARYRLPAICSFRADVAKGGLMCYGPDTADLFERAASRRSHTSRDDERFASAGGMTD